MSTREELSHSYIPSDMKLRKPLDDTIRDLRPYGFAGSKFAALVDCFEEQAVEPIFEALQQKFQSTESGVVSTTDVTCTCVGVFVMVGGFPGKEEMEIKNVMSKNVSIYKSQASALVQHAAPNS